MPHSHMDENKGMMLAVVVACIAGGTALRMKKQQGPEVSKGLLITKWVVVGLSVCAG